MVDKDKKPSRMTGRKLDIVECLKVGLDAAREAGEKIKEGRIYGIIGFVYHRRGDFRQAIDYHAKALATAEEVADRVGEGIAYCNLGKIISVSVITNKPWSTMRKISKLLKN